MTKSNLWIQGIYRDVVEDAQQNVVHDSGWVSNTITVNCRKLLASFVKNEQGEDKKQPQGICHLAVGQGKEAWDHPNLSDPDSPEPKDSTGLIQPCEDVPIDLENLDVEYLNADGAVEDGPTCRIRIKATLGDGYPQPLPNTETYPLREFGLFGKLGDDLYMINCVRHPKIDKHKSETLTREIILSF